MPDNNTPQYISHMELRKLLGTVGIAFPFILMIGHWIFARSFDILPSVSDYYASEMRDIFVGFLIAIGFFLLTYRYEAKDTLASSIAGFFACCIAFFPTTSKYCAVQIIHFSSAVLFFGILAYFCFFLFTLTKPGGTPTPRKLVRNKIYRICGSVISGSILLLGLYVLLNKVLQNFSLDTYHVIFWLEAIALFAFGFSWLVKGEFILKDL